MMGGKKFESVVGGVVEHGSGHPNITVDGSGVEISGGGSLGRKKWLEQIVET